MNKHQQEFIGKQIEIIESDNKEQKNIKGKIIDETKNTFKIKTEKKNNNNTKNKQEIHNRKPKNRRKQNNKKT